MYTFLYCLSERRCTAYRIVDFSAVCLEPMDLQQASRLVFCLCMLMYPQGLKMPAFSQVHTPIRLILPTQQQWSIECLLHLQ